MSFGEKPSLRHVAIIMDGNGRWAKSRFKPRIFGHRSSVSRVDSTIEYCTENDVQTLTLFAFGRDNWSRPKDEVDDLMELFLKTLESKAEKLHKNNVKLTVVGDRKRLSSDLLAKIEEVEKLTAQNSALDLRLAVDYAGRWEILEAVKSLCLDFSGDEERIKNIEMQDLEKKLVAGSLPVDLLIRTSGEVRLSDFMLWQLAYAEMYFTKVMWPDFTKKEMQKAVDYYYTRQRRFGKSS
ncbi:polyprenyl diphosphate synthase [Francisella frigiditurris]|uniref:Ditrans,polycis-undecaprenyl-diphosphate synthase ((2E,6E)-farnesyl-diphosphate specific) n=1 Tax=Francisella frigiditurris TaxID=1542390 RepID=A0A1J0KW01_9GAMM|nr:polyprenyl diphosphate synthase [Francisella frigiditurris]APC98000.1 di-trans,poly-cis-decaprenylcistransferase [Francisella frigiditurris]